VRCRRCELRGLQRQGVLVRRERTPRAQRQHTPLLDTQASRDLVLNKILSTDLRGIRLDLTRFFVIVDTEAPTEMTGYEFPIQLDVDDYRRKGNPVQIRDVVPTSINSWLRYVLGFYEKRVSVMNRDVVGGCATVTTDVERRRRVVAAEARLVLTAVGYQARWRWSSAAAILVSELATTWISRMAMNIPTHIAP
jgi:hypothetical protein